MANKRLSSSVAGGDSDNSNKNHSSSKNDNNILHSFLTKFATLRQSQSEKSQLKKEGTSSSSRRKDKRIHH